MLRNQLTSHIQNIKRACQLMVGSGVGPAVGAAVVTVGTVVGPAEGTLELGASEVGQAEEGELEEGVKVVGVALVGAKVAPGRVGVMVGSSVLTTAVETASATTTAPMADVSSELKSLRSVLDTTNS
jgi:hypothetical protein